MRALLVFIIASSASGISQVQDAQQGAVANPVPGLSTEQYATQGAIHLPAGFRASFWDNIDGVRNTQQAMLWMRSKKPHTTLIASTLNYEKAGNWQGLSAVFKHNFAAIFVSCLRVQRAGVYHFWTKSEDGSMLWINDHLVVDNDGLHSLATRRATYHLPPGVARLRIAYFYPSRGTGARLSAGWSGPGVRDRPFSTIECLQSLDSAGNQCPSENLSNRQKVPPEVKGKEITDKMDMKSHLANTVMYQKRQQPSKSQREENYIQIRRTQEAQNQAVLQQRAGELTSDHPGIDMDEFASATRAENIVFQHQQEADKHARQHANEVQPHIDADSLSA